VNKLKQLLPGELAASALDAAADEIVYDGLDSEHVGGQVDQDGEAAQYQQHACRAKLRLAAGKSCYWVVWLDYSHSAVTSQSGRRRRRSQLHLLQSV